MKEKNMLMAGAAKTDITPSNELMPIPFVGPICFNFIADRIHVRALYIDNLKEQSLLIAFDMGEVPYPEETVEFIHEISDISNENIFLTATHTHEVPFIGWALMPTDPETEAKYRKWYEQIKNAVKEAVFEAMSSKRPARMGYAEGKSYINVNRDELIDGKCEVGNNYERPSDKTLVVVRLEDEEQNPIALIVNYACHAVLLNGCLVNDGIGISGDIPGRTSTSIEDKLGGVVLWTSGAAGDQNPRVITNYGYDETGIKTKSLGEAGYMVLDGIVREHVRNILSVNEKLVCDVDSADIISKEKRVLVKAKGSKEEDEPSVPYILKLLRLGELAIMGISAEVVTMVGENVRKVSDAKHTILITHAQGCMGYVPDDWEFDHQSFIVGMSLGEKGCAEPVFILGFKELFGN